MNCRREARRDAAVFQQKQNLNAAAVCHAKVSFRGGRRMTTLAGTR
jgi:hypothetical protein